MPTEPGKFEAASLKAGESDGRFLERKLVTILSADVAGFSRMMGEDEEDTLRTFRGHKEVFESLVSMHRGRIFNTAGDAILAEFTSAVDAVRCATDIQSALRTRNDKLPPARQVRFRIGINLGDVLLQERDLLGDGVNVAARLQGAAEPGGICLSGSVHDQIQNKLSLSFRPLGELKFKNIQQPVRTFSIGGDSGSEIRPAAAQRLRRWVTIALPIAALAALGGIMWITSARRSESSPARSLARSSPASAQAATPGRVAPPETVTTAARVRTSRAPAEAISRLKQFDGVYSGPICYSETGTEPKRCYEASGIIRDSRIAGQWVMGREKKTDMILSGTVSHSGEVTLVIEQRSQQDSSRVSRIEFMGKADRDQIEADGAFPRGRTATLEWKKVSNVTGLKPPTHAE